MSGQLYYFAYGSNILTKRMKVNAKTAEKYANGLLKGFKLIFGGHSNFWKGSTAQIVPQNDGIVWGVIWTLNESDVEVLDKQEVGYNGINVNVCVNGTQETVICRVYVQKQVENRTDSSNRFQNDAQEDCDPASQYNIPSAAYKSVIIKGAIEHNLPEDYVESVLRSHPDNGNVNCGPPELHV